MKNLNEQRYLIQASIYYDEDGDGIYEVLPKNGGSKLAFKATDEQMLRFLRRVKIKDSFSEPRSYKGTTYSDMLNNIKQGINPVFYVWSNNYPSNDMLKEILE
jgi:hypothetical protein